MPTVLGTEFLPLIISDPKDISAVLTTAAFPSARKIGEKPQVRQPESALHIQRNAGTNIESTPTNAKLAFAHPSVKCTSIEARNSYSQVLPE
jgi:hypothetical protein